MRYTTLASACLATAFTVSAVFQVYRTIVGTNPEVDRFGVDTAIGYAFGFALAAAVRTDRRWVWWLVAVAMAAGLLFGIFGYYPMIYEARPMDVADWLEGTVYTGLLLVVLGLSVLRLTGTTIAPNGLPE